MKLIKFEIGRIFSRRFLIVVLIALLFLDAFNILYKYDKTWGVNADYHNSKYEFTKRLEGKITTEKVKWLKEHNELAQKAYDGKKVYTCPIKARNLSGRTGLYYWHCGG